MLRWQPGVFVPSPAEALDQPVRIIAGIVNSKAAPDQKGDALRGPDGRVKAMG